MSRSPYYPRRRSRVFQAVKRQAAKAGGEGESAGSFSCSLCDAHLPVVRVGDFLFVQASLGFVCKAPCTEVCPLRGYMAARATEKRAATLPSDSDGPAVHSA
jgi:hypothetical protein